MSEESPKQRRTPEEILAMREAGTARQEGTASPKPEASAAAPPPKVKPAPAVEAAPVAKAAPAKKRALKRAKKPQKLQGPQPVSRREFLNIAWLSAMALLTAQTVGVSVLFLYPNFREGEFGGAITLGPASEVLPEVDSVPVPYTEGKFWLTNTSKGIYALYVVCTHLGCLYAWIDTSHRFECPCHGSKFKLAGGYIEGPAPRSLDRFVVTATKPDGAVIETPVDGSGVKLDGDAILTVDTGRKIILKGHIEP